MSEQNGQSYLDLSVLPGLRESVLSARPVVVFTSTFEKAIWSNAAGAQLFGGTRVADLLMMDIPAANPIIQQLKKAAESLDQRRSITRGIRINRNHRSQMLQFEVQHLSLHSKDIAVMVTHLNDDEKPNLSEFELAKQAVSSLSEFADATAIVDGEASILFGSEKFADLVPDSDTFTNLVTELRSEEDRLIKRLARNTAEELIAIGLAKLNETPPRCLVVIAKADEDALEAADLGPDPAAPSADPVADSEEVAAPYADDLIEQEQENHQEHTIDTSEPGPETGDDLQAETGDYALEQEEAPETENAPIEIDEPELEATDNTSEAPIEDISEADDEPIDEPSSPLEQLETNHADMLRQVQDTTEKNATVRFAWTVDEQGVFTSVSEELSQTVGENAADIVGRRWNEIANVFGFDRDREIEELLEKRDTWSGKTVYWPVEGTDKIVPIDLAALPVFGVDRAFRGFRGYGKIATLQMQQDPEAIGLAFSDNPELNTPGNSETENSDNLPFEDHEPEIRLYPNEQEEHLRTTENPQDQNRSNILPFTPNRENEPVESLTESERSALEAVREHLRENEIDDDFSSFDGASPNVDTSLLEKLPVAVIVYRDSETLFVNQKLLDVSGYSSIEDLVDAGGVTALLGGEVEGEAETQQTLWQKDGSKIRINAVLHTVPWDQEKALLLSFSPPSDIVPDVLELTQISEVQNILDTTTDGIILLDDEGKIISINASAEALFAIDFEDAVDQELDFLFADESKETIKRYVESVKTAGLDSLINDGEEAIAREANGGMIPVFFDACPNGTDRETLCCYS